LLEASFPSACPYVRTFAVTSVQFKFIYETEFWSRRVTGQHRQHLVLNYKCMFYCISTNI